MSNPNQTPEVLKQTNFFGNLLNTKVGLVAAIGMSCAALFGLPKGAKADDGGYPWDNAAYITGEQPFDASYGYATKAECDSRGGGSCSSRTVDGWYYEDPWGFDIKNCTSYVAWKAHQEFGVNIPSSWGNADTWDSAASSNPNYTVTTNSPEPGDIAQWDSEHVAFVESVNPDNSVNVSEYNYTYPGGFDHRGEAYGTARVDADHYIDLNGVGVGIGGGSQPEITTNVIDRPLGVAAHANGEQDIFWRGSDGSLREAWWGGDHAWHSTGLGMGPLGSAPTAVVRPVNDHEDVFWKGKDNNLWEAYYDGRWNGPYVIPVGPMGSQPAATAWGSEVDVFWRGSDGNLWETWQSVPNGPWNGPRNLGMGPLGSAPTATSHSNGEQDVFWRGTDSNLWEDYRSPSDGKWYGPLLINGGMGPLGTAPTAVWQPGSNRQDVFWMGMDSNIWDAYWDGAAWHGVNFIGKGPLGSAPTAAAWGNEVDVYWRGMDSNLWETPGDGINFPLLFGIGMGPISGDYNP